MVSILPPKGNPWQTISRAISQFAQNPPPAIQQKWNQGRLEEGFNNLDSNANFTDQLKQIAPILLSTPGGAQALEALAPMLGTNAQNKSYKNWIDQRRDQTTAGSPTNANPSNPGMAPSQPKGKPQAPSEEDYYRHPEAYASPESLYPEKTVGPQEEPEMSVPQMEQQALNLMESSAATGKPISYPEAMNTVQNLNNQIRQKNQLIKGEKDTQAQANEKLTSGMITRAKNSGLIKDPEDETVAEKLALDARRFENENQRWLYVRNGLRKFDENKSKIQRAASIAGPLDKIYRKGIGSYQDKDEIIRSVQPAIDDYKKYGLYDELRDDLRETLGLGPEDIETAIFPPSKEVKKQINDFPKNPKKMINRQGEEPLVYKEMLFPGEEFKLPEDQFDTFKENIANIISSDPKINLESLKGRLNREKRYAWQDIGRAVEELVGEGRFVPDVIQEKQMGLIGKPPAAGFLDLFWDSLKGTQ
jgi:hypothetical protein